MIKVYSAQILALVEHMKHVLMMYGIEASIRNQYLSAAIGEIPPHEAWPQLWVSDQDFERAREVIREAESDPPESNKICICPACGEEVEGQFAACWNCGTAMD